MHKGKAIRIHSVKRTQTHCIKITQKLRIRYCKLRTCILPTHHVHRLFCINHSINRKGRIRFTDGGKKKKNAHAYERKVEAENQFVFRNQHLFCCDLFVSLCIRSRQAKCSVWLKAMIVGGLYVSDQFERIWHGKNILHDIAMGGCYAVTFEHVNQCWFPNTP